MTTSSSRCPGCAGGAAQSRTQRHPGTVESFETRGELVRFQPDVDVDVLSAARFGPRPEGERSAERVGDAGSFELVDQRHDAIDQATRHVAQAGPPEPARATRVRLPATWAPGNSGSDRGRAWPRQLFVRPPERPRTPEDVHRVSSHDSARCRTNPTAHRPTGERDSLPLRNFYAPRRLHSTRSPHSTRMRRFCGST